jgi:hypothetical protein
MNEAPSPDSHQSQVMHLAAQGAGGNVGLITNAVPGKDKGT